ncbi:MAG: pilus assembly protein [Planctomycetaceae bacterium]|nr:pilus assembly protein [Planctomycetales bacterium]MCB9922777.1 pilus assembly protein [Planctomycetaceae bacterium]
MKTVAHQNSRGMRQLRSSRRGTTLVEFAMVLPVFFTFVFGIVEYGRLQLVSNMLKTACRTGARLGSTENVTTAEAQSRVEEILAAALDTDDLTVIVKDASVFDTPGPYPASATDFNALSDIELDDAEPRQLFLIRATVSYNDIALIPFSVLNGVQLSGQSLMRHE